MTDLITRAKDYLAQTEGITKDAIWKSVDTLEGEYVLVNCEISTEHFSGFFRASDIDETAMALTPTARKLIEELVEKLEDYKDRIEELTNAVDYFTGDARQGIYTAIGIMTENKEIRDVYKRLAKR